MIAKQNDLIRLRELRGPLLKLHKVLLDHERDSYEAAHHMKTSPGELVRLAMFDPWFDWLRRISELIVRMDELLEKDDATVEDADALFLAARGLFRAQGNDTEFQTRYKLALQKDPASVLAHMEVQRALFSDS